MRFNVTISSDDFCGLEMDYILNAPDEGDAEDIAMEEHLDHFVTEMGLVEVDSGEYIQEDELEDYENGELVSTTTISAKAVEV